jgi:DNA-binding phage protein
MARIAEQKKQKTKAKKQLVAHVPFESPELKDSKLLSETLIDCIRSGDLNAFREVLASHIMNSNKVQLSKKTGIGRRTLYDILDPTINFNPELSTVSAIIRGFGK